MTKTHQFLGDKRSIGFSHPEFISEFFFHGCNLSDGMPKKFRHDKNINTNFYPIKEALALVILNLFQDPSSRIVAFLMGCRKDFGMTKNINTNFYPIKEALPLVILKFFSGSLFYGFNLSDGMPKRFRHDKNTPIFRW
ncbi:MAG: hypothetical protein V5804_09895 [Mucilaginibacter sp.]|uniref:hypothetical protein n=1 Tax=Mucilaginibacter sp. TaxID=1882438 RepID=UPI0034E5F897